MFLTRDGTVKVLDFGIARVRELSTPQTTLAGSAIGTPAFMAPEQARGRWQDVDGRTDLWAVGATLYTLITGKFVHAGENAHETLALAATRPARSIAERRPDLHPSLIAFVDKALSYDMAARFPDAATMQHVLRLTYAQMEGNGTSQAMKLAIPDLQSMPPARAITVRNLKPPGRLTMSGQPTIKRSSAARGTAQRRADSSSSQHAFAALVRDRRRVWLLLTAVAAFALVAFVWLRSRAEDTPARDSGARAADVRRPQQPPRPVSAAASTAPGSRPRATPSGPSRPRAGRDARRRRRAARRFASMICRREPAATRQCPRGAQLGSGSGSALTCP